MVQPDGRGLVGLAISALGGDEVVLTDDGASLVSDGGASKSAIDVLRENIALNAGRARAAALRWGDDAALRKLEPKSFDCVVGSDLLYDPSSYTSLLKTLEACGCEAHIAITRRHAGERAFFALAERRFDVVATTPLRWPADVRRPDANAGPFVVPLERVRRGERLRHLSRQRRVAFAAGAHHRWRWRWCGGASRCRAPSALLGLRAVHCASLLFSSTHENNTCLL